MSQNTLPRLKTSRFDVNLSGADYNNTKRTHLYRSLKGSDRRIIVLMDSPSTADAVKNDTTVTKLRNRLEEVTNYKSYSLLNVGTDCKLFENLKLLLEDDDCDILIAWGAKIRNTKYISNQLRKTITNMCDTQNIFEFNQGRGELMPNRIKKNTPLRNATQLKLS